VLWFDALVGNVDRSWRNPNMLFWHGRPYLIDHGATLTFHHNWAGADGAAQRPYDASEHALLGCDPDLAAAAELDVNPEAVRAALSQVPDEWLADEPGFDSPDAVRARYAEFFAARLAARGQWEGRLRAAIAAGPQRRDRGHARPRWLR
jgi:hypothetical protein